VSKFCKVVSKTCEASVQICFHVYPYGTQNFTVASIFLENLCNPALYKHCAMHLLMIFNDNIFGVSTCFLLTPGAEYNATCTT